MDNLLSQAENGSNLVSDTQNPDIEPLIGLEGVTASFNDILYVDRPHHRRYKECPLPL